MLHKDIAPFPEYDIERYGPPALRLSKCRMNAPIIIMNAGVKARNGAVSERGETLRAFDLDGLIYKEVPVGNIR